MDAFDDPVNIVSTVMTICAAVIMCIALSLYTKRELKRIESIEQQQREASKGGNELGDYSPVGLSSPEPLEPSAVEASPEPESSALIVMEENVNQSQVFDEK